MLNIKQFVGNKAFGAALCAVIVFVAAIVRLACFGWADIGGDECFSLYYALKSPGDIVRVMAHGDNPPLWELLLHYWVIGFGANVPSIRMLSVIFSALTVVPLYLAGERHVGRGAGVAASLMYSFSTFSVFLAHDGRVYSLVAMLAAWSLNLFLSLATDDRHRRSRWVWLTVVDLLLLYSHYMAGWVPVVQCLLVFLLPSLRRHLWRGCLCHIGALLLGYLPMLPVLYHRILDSGVHGTWVSRSSGIDSLYNMLMCFTNAPVVTVLALALILAAVVWTVVMMCRKRYSIGVTTLITAIWAVPMLVSFGVSFFLGCFLNRYFYFLLPVYYLALVAYLYSLLRRPLWLRWLLVGVLVVMMVLTVHSDSTQLRHAGWKGDTRAVAYRLCDDIKCGGCEVVVAPSWIDKQLVYYFDPLHAVFRNEGRLEEPVFYDYLTARGFIYCDQPRDPVAPTVYVVREPWYGFEDWEMRLVEAGYQLVEVEKHQQMNIETYRRIQ